MNPDNSKPITRKEIREIMESCLDDYLSKEEAEKLIEKKYWELRKEEEKLWKCERAYP